MAKKPYILHQFIYSSSETRDGEEPSFWVRHGWGLGVILSLIVHTCIGGAFLYKRYIAPYEIYEVVDKEIEIQWINLNDPRFKPLKNPGNLFVTPTKTLTLEEMERLRKEEEKRKALEKAKQKPKEHKATENKKDNQKPDQGSDEGSSTDDTKKSGSGIHAGATTTDNPPKFGVINSRPIKEIVGTIYEKYKQGDLKVDNAVFSITVTFKVHKDGSLTNVDIVKSSGSKEIDEAAFNLIHAISESHALSPLSSLSSTTVTLDNGPTFSNLRVTGFAAAPEDASTLASVFNTAILFQEYQQRDQKPELADLFRNLQVKADGKRLTGSLSLTRNQATMLMRKSFNKTT